jgi:hypothetical protein
MLRSARLGQASVRAATGALLGVFLWFGSGGIRGNDTGGIIPWSPGIEDYALALVSDHCGRHGKYGVITSVRPWPGDYIGFVCRRPGRWGPAFN